MNTGVSFQPGASDGPMGQSRPQSSPSSNIQEAIKVLSLRLPKVVGARGIAPTPLLTSQGSGGNSRIDSVVNQVMSRMFPTAAASPGAPPPAPMLPNAEPSAPSNAPSFDGASVAPYQPQQQTPQQAQPFTTAPRIVFDGGIPQGDFTVDESGRPKNPNQPAPSVGGVFEQAPDLSAFTDWLTNNNTPPDNGGGWGSGGGGSDSWI